MLTAPLVARVHLLDAPYYADKSYDYFITAELRDNITAGCFVSVPFGGGNRVRLALVTEISDSTEVPTDRLKPVRTAVNESVALSNELLGICGFLKEHTFCTIGDAVRTILPASALSKLCEYYTVSDEIKNDKSISESMLAVYSYIKKSERTTDEDIRTALGDSALRAVPALVKGGYIARTAEISDKDGGRYTVYAEAVIDENLTNDAPLLKTPPKGKKQAAVYEYLTENGRCTSDELKSIFGSVAAQLNALEQSGFIRVTKEDSYRSPYSDSIPIPLDDNELSEEQSTAAEKIISLYKSGEPRAALLHGVTGSGKTRVIKKLIDCVADDGKSVIILIPEISLTPQTAAFFRSYYGERVCVLHSALSAGERFDAWRRMKRGEADICVGTRSAIFAPFENIGMIVIDEEQENTYKSDMNPRYHARDIARYRCGIHGSLMLLASATPSLESYMKAKNGIYTLVELKQRYGSASIPNAVITDTREDTRMGDMSAIGHVLRGEIADNLARGEQTVLFLNRRGYNHFLSCPMCGEVVTCPNCSVSLTYHTNGESAGYLVCHYCGYRAPKPQICPSCGSEHINYQGFGTQKAEKELHETFPSARIMRMDADTTGSKSAYVNMLTSFRDGEADILLGTQMVAKGHNFPRVTLVGVISADMSLYLDDYRSNEKTFDLITQVVGRAGRTADENLSAGRAVIQTFNPDHPVLKLSAEQDYIGFYENEIALRSSLVFPPFCDIVSLTLTGEAENELKASADYLSKSIKTIGAEKYSDIAMTVFGPIEPFLYKLNSKFRLRFIIKCRANTKTRAFMRAVLEDFDRTLFKKISAAIDINPSSL